MKLYKYGIYLIFGVVLLSSCKKQLDLQPTDVFSEENAFRVWADVQQGANGAYGRYGAYANDMYVNALLSDEAKLGLGNSGQGALTYRYQYASDNTTGADVIAGFGAYYSLIDQINRVLPVISTVPASPSEEPRRNIVRAQLLALRAIAHFSLLEMYSKTYDPADPLGVPIMLKSAPLGKPARNTVAQVLTQIETDLNDAKGALPAVTVSSFTDTTMNKVNIAAYQARVALYKRDYAAAITYSTEVISSNVKPLVTGADFAGIWTDANTNEILFRIRYATSGAISSLWGTTAAQTYVAPSDKLIASYGATDIRKAAYIGSRAGGDNYVNKFYSSSKGAAVDIKAARIAEMYLIRAEAYAKKTGPDLVSGAADLNAVRAKRIGGYVNETFGSASDLINAVLAERFKELCFEGFRFFDLKRNNLSVQRLASDASPAWQTLSATSPLFVLPIPRSETDLNPNMVQTPGY